MHEWIFSGIGTAIVSGVAGLLLGGSAGFFVGQRSVKQKTRQKQKAKDNAIQVQQGNIVNNYGIK